MGRRYLNLCTSFQFELVNIQFVSQLYVVVTNLAIKPGTRGQNDICIIIFPNTPPFPPDSCYLSGSPCQMITRQLSDACQMSLQTSVNSHQTSIKQVPHMPGVNVVLVWQDVWLELTGVWWGNVWQSSVNHLTWSTRQIATVWRKWWSRDITVKYAKIKHFPRMTWAGIFNSFDRFQPHIRFRQPSDTSDTPSNISNGRNKLEVWLSVNEQRNWKKKIREKSNLNGWRFQSAGYACDFRCFEIHDSKPPNVQRNTLII